MNIQRSDGNVSSHVHRDVTQLNYELESTMDLIQLSVTIVVAFGGAYFGGKQALKNYYSQRWWDRKADAYAKFTQHNRNLIELCKKAYFEGSDRNEARQYVKQFNELSDKIYLDSLESSAYLTQEAVNLISSIRSHTFGYSLEIVDFVDRSPELQVHQPEFRTLVETGAYLRKLISELEEKSKRFSKLMRKDLNIREKSRTDQLIDWAFNLIKSFKQRYRLGGNSD